MNESGLLVAVNNYLTQERMQSDFDWKRRHEKIVRILKYHRVLPWRGDLVRIERSTLCLVPQDVERNALRAGRKIPPILKNVFETRTQKERDKASKNVRSNLSEVRAEAVMFSPDATKQ